MNNQAIFLAKIQQALTLLDEIDDIIERNPEMQQNVDWEISDYLHLLENEELSEKARLEIDTQLARCRKIRRQLVNIYTVGKVYNDNRDKLRFKTQRAFLVSNLTSQIKKLDCDYKYRVLDQGTIDSYVKNEKEILVEKPKQKKLGKKRISKEELLEMIESGMQNKEIAEKIGLSPSALCHLKDEYGIARREYKKKGE